MNSKEKTIELVTPSGHKQGFSIQHAERLLAMGDTLNGGWRIVNTEKYSYSKEDGIRIKSNKANNSASK